MNDQPKHEVVAARMEDPKPVLVQRFDCGSLENFWVMAKDYDKALQEIASLREENLSNFAARMELQGRVQVLESRLREYRRYTQSAPPTL
jgi:hypothetical protein